MRGISWLAENRLAYHEGVSKQVSKAVSSVSPAEAKHNISNAFSKYGE